MFLFFAQQLAMETIDSDQRCIQGPFDTFCVGGSTLQYVYVHRRLVLLRQELGFNERSYFKHTRRNLLFKNVFLITVKF